MILLFLIRAFFVVASRALRRPSFVYRLSLRTQRRIPPFPRATLLSTALVAPLLSGRCSRVLVGSSSYRDFASNIAGRKVNRDSFGRETNGRVERALNARIAAIASAGAYRRLFLRLDIDKRSTTCSSH